MNAFFSRGRDKWLALSKGFQDERANRESTLRRLYRTLRAWKTTAIHSDQFAVPAKIKFENSGSLTLEIEATPPNHKVESRAIYELKRRGNRYKFRLRPGTVPAELTRDASGEIATIKFRHESAGGQLGTRRTSKPTFESIFRLKTRGSGTVLQALDVPSYYLSRVEKKIDIRGEWAEPFNRIAEPIVANRKSLLDYDRLYTLWQAVRNVAALDSAIIEVGVFRGGSTRLLAEAQNHFKKPGKIYACDTFSGHPRVDPEMDARHEVAGFGGDIKLEDVISYLKIHPDVEIVVGDIMRTAGTISDQKLAMLHLDVDTYNATKFCLEEFGSRLEPEGIIIVDDYGFETCPGAKLAADQFVAANKRMSLMHLLTGQAILFQTGR